MVPRGFFVVVVSAPVWHQWEEKYKSQRDGNQSTSAENEAEIHGVHLTSPLKSHSLGHRGREPTR